MPKIEPGKVEKMDAELVERIRKVIRREHGSAVARASVITKNQGGFFYVHIAQRIGNDFRIHGLSDVHGRRRAMEKWCEEREDKSGQTTIS